MPLQISFTDEFGETFPNSFWEIASINITPADKTGRLVFYGYESSEKAGKRIIGQKAYDLSPLTWDAFFQASGLILADVLSPCYQFASLVPEPLPVDAPKGTTPRSFFDGATTVNG